MQDESSPDEVWVGDLFAADNNPESAQPGSHKHAARPTPTPPKGPAVAISTDVIPVVVRVPEQDVARTAELAVSALAHAEAEGQTPMATGPVPTLTAAEQALLARLQSRGGRAARSGRGGRSGRVRARSHKHRSLFRRALAVAASFTFVLLAGTGGLGLYLYHKYDGQLSRVGVLQEQDPHIRDAARQQGADNFLVIGSDTRAGTGAQFGSNVQGARSDTTMIVHLSPDHGKASIISIPRDAWVDIPACKNSDGSTAEAHVGQFNSAFAAGGPTCSIATVQLLTGIAITHFLEIDFSGFESMVNAIGTVTICSPQPVNDPSSGLLLHRGNNNLDGQQALAYVRARESLGDGSDLGRIKRQQMFMGTILRQAMQGSMLANPTRLTSFLDAATHAITVDKGTTIGDLRALGTSLQGLDPAKVIFYTAPISDPNYSPPGTNQTGRVLLDPVKGHILYDSVIMDKVPVWVTTQAGKTTVIPSPTGAATTTPKATTTPAPAPTSNLNAAQQTCSL